MASIDNTIYDRVADTWWDGDGFMALLRTAVHPPRLAYFREVLAPRFHGGLNGLRVIDVGCGGGLLCEPFAREGCDVTGIDLSEPTLAAARRHAAAGGLRIDYRLASAEALPFEDAGFDIAICCDVLEHVEDVDRVVAGIARVLKPGGVFLFDTINRTLRSRLLAIKLAQDWWPTRMIPRDVHVWEKFIRPGELRAALERHDLEPAEFAGLAPPKRPLRALGAFAQLRLGRIGFAEFGSRLQLRRGRNLSVSWMGYAIRRPCA